MAFATQEQNRAGEVTIPGFLSPAFDGAVNLVATMRKDEGTPSNQPPIRREPDAILTASISILSD
jgi:hypothetical protein